jgi:hypothetical protein
MKTIILPIVLYVCETWSITLRDEHWLRVFESRVLMRTFEPKRDEVTGDLSKLHKEKLDVGGHVARMGEKREMYKVLVGNPEGKRPLGIPSFRWENEKGMDLRETGCGNVEWIQMARNRGR